MAIDKSRENDFHQKKCISVFSGVVAEGTEDAEIPAASGDYILAYLPHDSVILDAYIHVVTPSDAVTSAVATLGTTEGGSEILSGADLTTPGEQGTFTGQSPTGTGVPLYLGVAVTGAATEVGEYVVSVEYTEYTKNTGELTYIPSR